MVKVEKIWLDDAAVWIRTADGKEACEYFADYPRLRCATPQQRAAYTADAVGIHWTEIDEDLSFDGFFTPKNENAIYRLFIAHPELNASAVARRIGMAQSLLAQYISGIKRPSKEREELIRSELRKIGRDLTAI